MNFTRSLSGSKSSQKDTPLDKSPSSPSEKSNKSPSETPSKHVKLPASFCGIHIFESKESDEISLKCLPSKENSDSKADDALTENGHIKNTVEKVCVRNSELNIPKCSNIPNGKNNNTEEKIEGSHQENLNIESTSYNGVSSRL